MITRSTSKRNEMRPRDASVASSPPTVGSTSKSRCSGQLRLPHPRQPVTSSPSPSCSFAKRKLTAELWRAERDNTDN